MVSRYTYFINISMARIFCINIREARAAVTFGKIGVMLVSLDLGKSTTDDNNFLILPISYAGNNSFEMYSLLEEICHSL